MLWKVIMLFVKDSFTFRINEVRFMLMVEGLISSHCESMQVYLTHEFSNVLYLHSHLA